VRRRQLNPRQRQGLLLVAIAAVGLIGVFLLIASYVADVSKQVGPKLDVLELTSPAVPYQPITASQLGEVSVPAKWAPHNALRNPAQAAGLVASVALPAGTELQQGMLTPPPALESGQREIAILVDAETGVAGQVTPGAFVDIVATFGSHQSADSKTSARVIVPDAQVLNVGTPTVAGGTASGSSQAINARQVVPVTLALSPADVLKVSYAESFAQQVRLSIIAPGTSGPPAKPGAYQPGF
jgi:pilus assembly protein CpaB